MLKTSEITVCIMSFQLFLQYFITPYKPPAPIFESRIELKIEELNKYSNWSLLAKEYISNQSESINLMNVVDEYYAMVTDFYNWFQTRQREIHSQELAKVVSVQQEIEDLTKKT